MGVQFILLLVLTIFKVESFPIKVYQINQRQSSNYEVFKDILIQNLIVTTDNLKLILNLERENTLYRIQDDEKLNTKLTNYNTDKILSPFQHGTASKNGLQKKITDEEKVQDRIETKRDIPNSQTTKDIPVNLNSFELSKYLIKRSSDEVDKPTAYEIKSEVKEEEEEQENYDNNESINKRETNEYSSIILSEENLLNYGNSNSLELDNMSDSEHNTRKAKRQAEGETPIPRGDGDTQMFMGTFQAVMRPMTLPSLG